MITTNRQLHLAAVVAAMAFAPLAQAAADGVDSPRPKRLGADWVAIEHGRLDAMRGGFQLGSGMTVSFGIERAAFVNGELVASTRLSIPDVANMTTEQAMALRDLSQGMVVQVGEGNRVESTPGINGLVIQNSLDNQDIRAATIVSVTVDTLGLYQQLNTQAALQDAVQGALGGP